VEGGGFRAEGAQQRACMLPRLSGPHSRLSSCVQNQRTPLHWAAIYGYAEASKALLKRKADPNARDTVMPCGREEGSQRDQGPRSGP